MEELKTFQRKQNIYMPIPGNTTDVFVYNDQSGFHIRVRGSEYRTISIKNYLSPYVGNKLTTRMKYFTQFCDLLKKRSQPVLTNIEKHVAKVL